MGTYIAQAGDTVVTGATGLTEDNTILGGAIAWCGQAATAALDAAYGAVASSVATVTDFSQQSIAAGEAIGPNGRGGTTPSQLQWLSGAHGVPLQNIGIAQALGEAGKTPIVLGLANGAAIDPWAPALRGHYIDIFGRTAGGLFIANDPNSPQSQAGQLVTLTPQQISNAQPFAALVPTGSNPFLAFASPTSSTTASATNCSNSTFGVGWIGTAFCNLGSNAQNLVSTIVALVVRGGVILFGLVLILLAIFLLMRDNGAPLVEVGI